MTFVISCAPLNLDVASSADVNVLFLRMGGGGWWENGERTGSDDEVLLILFSFSHSQTLMVNVTITKGVACKRG